MNREFHSSALSHAKQRMFSFSEISEDYGINSEIYR